MGGKFGKKCTVNRQLEPLSLNDAVDKVVDSHLPAVTCSGG